MPERVVIWRCFDLHDSLSKLGSYRPTMIAIRTRKRSDVTDAALSDMLDSQHERVLGLAVLTHTGSGAVCGGRIACPPGADSSLR